MEHTSKFKIITNEKLLSKYLSAEMFSYFCKKQPSEDPSYIKLKIAELLKYLVLSHFTSGPIPFSEEIDTIWHLWILQTQQYKELCLSLPGNKFIHHSSNDYNSYPPSTTSKEEVSRQLSFLVSYFHNFGEFSDKTLSFWPYVGKIMTLEELNIKEFNTYLAKIVESNAA